MNIKDRLSKTRKIDTAAVSAENDVKPQDIAFDNDIVINIMEEQINNLKNIIFVSDNLLDNKIAAKYFENCIKNYPKTTISAADFNIERIENNKVNIIPEISGKNITVILEQALCGVKSFILGIHLNSYDNFLEKLKTIIMINSNLKETNTDILLTALDAIIVNVQSNDEGSIYVKIIDKIETNNSKLSLKNLYTFLDSPAFDICETKQENIQDSLSKEEAQKTKADLEKDEIKLISPAEKPQTETKSLHETDEKENMQPDETQIKSIPAPADETKQPDEIKPAKINKYKLLKEKIKTKKNV